MSEHTEGNIIEHVVILDKALSYRKGTLPSRHALFLTPTPLVLRLGAEHIL